MKTTYLHFNPNDTHLTATYKTSEKEVHKITLILDEKFANDKRDSIKIDFARFITADIMDKYEDDMCDSDLLVVYPEDPIHPIHAK